MNENNYFYAKSIISTSSYRKCQTLTGLSANCDSPSLYHFFNYFHSWWKCHSIAQDKGLTKSGCGGSMEVSTLI